MHRLIVDKIKEKTARICVIGLGYVGLPTAVVFAEKGYRVVGCDVKESVVRAVDSGRSPLKDLDIEERVREVVESGRLEASCSIVDGVRRSDITLIIVPTPTREGFEPDLDCLLAAGEETSRGLRSGRLVVLESTVYPGVTEDILKPILEKSGLKVGRDFGLAYCPERYNPGDSQHTIDKVVRVLGAATPEWAAIAARLYEGITRVVVVRNIRTAEMAKIIENTQRDLNIALMNEIALICERMGIDVVEVIDAAATKWNFNKYYPGAGVGGHCLPKDPWYLVKAAEKLGYHAQIISAGRRVNDYMPHHVFDLLGRCLNQMGRPINGSKIVLLGLAYKENMADTRNSPSLPLIEMIREAGGRVCTVDACVPKDVASSVFGSMRHYSSIERCLAGANAIVVMTAHSEFERIDLGKVREKMDTPIIVDGRRLFNREEALSLGFCYRSVGGSNDDFTKPRISVL